MNSNTNTNFMNNKEEKVLDGVYITRNSKSKDSLVKNTERDVNRYIPSQSKYVYRSTAELIALLENDFEQIFKEIQMLYKANEEMIEYDPHDYDLIEAREENLEIINKKLNELMEIQSQLRQQCPTNPLVTKNIFDFFKEIQKSQEKEEFDKIDEEKPSESLDSAYSISNIEINLNVESTSLTENGNEIIRDIEL